ncbi:MAG: DoxX family protein [Bryobacteraceae bacterium]|nr:DoxX family protein [Bryobacteraceae bacterium]
MPLANSGIDYRLIPLALIRIVIGWHFLYEGWAKVLNPGWTSAGFLKSSTGPVAGLYHFLGSNSALIRIVDQVNIWGLVLIGLALMLGLYARAAAVGGMALLALYYFAYPPFFTPVLNGVTEGSYLIVNKNLVELFGLAVVAAFPAAAFGLEGILARLKNGAAPEETLPPVAVDKAVPEYLGPLSRRHVLTGLAGVPVLGGFVLAVLKKHGWRSFEEAHLRGVRGQTDEFTASATVKKFSFASISDLEARLPYGKIGNITLSRMILGGNLIGGWAHARDLIYVSKLVRAYHHRDKIFETLALAEKCGVNAIITNPLLCGIMNDYWRNGGRIQFISDCGGQNVLEMIQRSIDHGACACYIQGGVADRLVEEGKFDLMAQGLDLIRRNRLPAGIGGHKLETIKASVDKGLRPDFWMKTLHHVNYWSAKPQPENDNIWCDSPEATIEFMKTLKEPWIAFKILAAGAIPPEIGFKWAFESGADFICVGMYDFQIVEDVNLAARVLNGTLVRQRQWYA